MVLLGDKAQVEARFGPFGDSADLTQDRCTVYAKRIIGLEIIGVAHVDSHFGPFRDGVSVRAR
jgi:hypothetical protein